jgi:uncharacterized membrane protein YphA (DoxX/SURF4 family)
MTRSTLLLSARFVIGAIFLLAAIDKITAPGAFAEAVRSYQLLPASLSLPFAYVVPWLELLAAAYLLSGFLARIGAGLAGLMLVMFLFALGHAMLTGNVHHACGCFGQGANANPVLEFLSGGSTITTWDIIRDALLLGLSAVIAVIGPGGASVDAWVRRRQILAER